MYQQLNVSIILTTPHQQAPKGPLSATNSYMDGQLIKIMDGLVVVVLVDQPFRQYNV